jgi:hypothetical protein
MIDNKYKLKKLSNYKIKKEEKEKEKRVYI